jgi:DNA-directed RNA polymerase subunit H (RpoH/RPB5)
MSKSVLSDKKNVNSMSLLVKMDSESIRKEVLTNIIKMVRYRGYLDKKKWNEKRISSLIKDRVYNNIYVIPLDIKITPDTNSPDNKNNKDNKDNKEEFDNKNIYVKLISQKINSVSSSPIVNDFLKQHSTKYKIIIFDDISDRAKEGLKEYKHIEVFKEKFFMLDLLSIDASPDYEILSDDDVIQLKKSYGIDNKKMKKMQLKDPATMYLNLKRGQIVRIIRNSEQNIKSIDYRRVCKS